MKSNTILVAKTFTSSIVLLIILLPFINCSTPIMAQQVHVIVDTIYHTYAVENDQVLLLNREGDDVIYENNKVEAFPADIQNYQKFYDTNTNESFFLLESNDKCFFTKGNLTFDPLRYINVKLSRIVEKLDHVLYANDMVSYIKGDSLFLANLISHKTQFLKVGYRPSRLYEDNLYIRELDGEDHFIYDILSQEYLQLPKSLKFAEKTPYFIIDFSSGTYLDIFDNRLTSVHKPGKKFIDYTLVKEFLILHRADRTFEVYHKDKLLELSEKITKFHYQSSSNLLVLKNQKNNLVFINDEGKLLFEGAFDNEISDVGNDTHIILKSEGKTMLFDPEFNLLIEGNFRSMKRLSATRFIVDSGGNFLLINKKKEPLRTINRNNSLDQLNRIDWYGTEIFGETKSLFGPNEIYNYEGELIVSWQDREEDGFYYAGFRKGLNRRVVSELSDEQEKQINPSRLWIERVKDDRNRDYFYACDKLGNRISERFVSMTRLDKPNQFLVQIRNKGRYGIVEINVE